ncbi:hypothetical protein IGI04_035583 [Brassica rapa subsp. trilocularis]|uniref:Uncharacterized protein n=1 Tax=Brassica rapa subsp. trilocularis TaxID=1813537 RepID=A0ABQ7LC53_BRACM|nr:hypothetical protein IGI04_035583 [Brassica rapa subsp. trilocularis]
MPPSRGVSARASQTAIPQPANEHFVDLDRRRRAIDVCSYFQVEVLEPSPVWAHKIANLQFTPAAVRNMVVAFVIGAEVGVDVISVILKIWPILAEIQRLRTHIATILSPRMAISKTELGRLTIISSCGLAQRQLPITFMLLGVIGTHSLRHPIFFPPPAKLFEAVEAEVDMSGSSRQENHGSSPLARSADVNPPSPMLF